MENENKQSDGIITNNKDNEQINDEGTGGNTRPTDEQTNQNRRATDTENFDTETGDKRTFNQIQYEESIKYYNNAKGFKASTEFNNAIKNFDPEISQPQHAEFYDYTDKEYARFGYF